MKSASVGFWFASRLGFVGMFGLSAAPMLIAESYLLSRALAPAVMTAPIETHVAPEIITPTPAQIPSTPAPVVAPVEAPTNTPPPRPAMRTGARAVAIEVYHAAGDDAYARWTEGRHARGW